MTNHVRGNLRRSRLEKSGGERLAGARARRKMRGGLGYLICQRVKIQHLRIGVNRRNAVLVRFRLHVGENVVALLHLHQRIADVAGQRVKHAPVVVHGLAARFAVDVAGKRNVAAVGKHGEQFTAHSFVFDGVKRPGAQPRAVEGNQIHQRITGMNGRQALLDAEARDARVNIFRALRRGGLDLICGKRIRGFQFCAMYFRLPLQVRILVHLVGPDGRVQLEAAGNGDDFLAVGHAMCAHDARHSDALGFAEILFAQLGPTARARSGLNTVIPSGAHWILVRGVEESWLDRCVLPRSLRYATLGIGPLRSG